MSGPEDLGQWQAGDLALALGEKGPNHPPEYRRGGIYTVSEVVENHADGLGLLFQDLPLPPSQKFIMCGLIEVEKRFEAWAATFFRRIPPHEADEQDRITIRLLNGMPVLGDA